MSEQDRIWGEELAIQLLSIVETDVTIAQIRAWADSDLADWLGSWGYELKTGRGWVLTEEASRVAEYDSLMAQGQYWAAAEVAGLKCCDICFRSEIDDILSGKSDEEIPMSLDEEGLRVCRDCQATTEASGA